MDAQRKPWVESLKTIAPQEPQRQKLLVAMRDELPAMIHLRDSATAIEDQEFQMRIDEIQRMLD